MVAQIAVQHGPSTLLTALLTALGAIAAGALGALFATWRQNKQLDYDRESREHEALMSVIDDGAIALGDAHAAVIRVARFWALSLSSEKIKHSDAQEKQRETMAQCRSAQSRLRLRLSQEDPILQHYETATGALNDLVTLYRDSPDPHAAEIRPDGKRLQAILREHQQAYTETVRRRLGPMSKRITRLQESEQSPPVPAEAAARPQ
jgi:hypothetical protein